MTGFQIPSYQSCLKAKELGFNTTTMFEWCRITYLHASDRPVLEFLSNSEIEVKILQGHGVVRKCYAPLSTEIIQILPYTFVYFDGNKAIELILHYNEEGIGYFVSGKKYNKYYQTLNNNLGQSAMDLWISLHEKENQVEN